VAQTNQHAKIIAAAAKSALTPLGFQRKGASRIWFADKGYWLLVIEFQPSAWEQRQLPECGGTLALVIDQRRTSSRPFVRLRRPRRNVYFI
jgi:hypothetical protein